MARYKGPRVRISRRFGVAIFGNSKYLERRQYPPGVHGPRQRRKNSEYALGLMEKQKMRYYYGLLEKQFRNIFEMAARRRGVTGTIMLEILETRLDNVVYRAGFASSRKEARQMVKHEHFTVNGKKVSIPSFLVKPGMVVEVKEKSRNHARIIESLDTAAGRGIPEWITLDKQNFKAEINRLPERTDIAYDIQESLIVELYSK